MLFLVFLPVAVLAAFFAPGGRRRLTDEPVPERVPGTDVIVPVEHVDPDEDEMFDRVIRFMVGKMKTTYAAGSGDDLDLELSAEDRAVVANAAAARVPVVTLLIFGRPLIVDEALEASDAFAAIWLPGSEGDGIADVLFGDRAPKASSRSRGRARRTSIRSTSATTTWIRCSRSGSG